MNQLNALSDFFTAIEKDPRISITHIGLYAALVQYWREHGFEDPIYAFSYEIMQVAKISTKTTYHKIIKDLSSYGYIRYEPSYKRNKGGKIFVLIKESGECSAFENK